jgi:hypothetical protein
MKRVPKVRWYPYWMLSIGVLLLLLACAMYIIRLKILEGYYIVDRGSRWGIGSEFATCAVAGFLMTGIGIYALRHKKD